MESKVEVRPKGQDKVLTMDVMQWVATSNFLKEYMNGIKLYDISSTTDVFGRVIKRSF